MKKFKKIARCLFIVAVIVFAAIILSGTIFYHTATYGITLNEEKLGVSKFASTLEIYDNHGKKINFSCETFAPIEKLSANTKNAFIATEDKRFYTHSGIDYLRIFGALASNIKSQSFSEGASTISQQLIKNTQLSSEKTIKRKLKEFKLASILEKKFTKNEILEMYLNNIYFGNGCYGIENAAKHYFNKSAANLTLAESAILAGTINAPGIYDIEDHPEKAIARRNLVLSLMEKQGKISKAEKEKSQNEELKLNLTNITNNAYLLNEVINEACKITGKTENQLKNSNLKIHTYYDSNLSNDISKTIKENYSNIESSPKSATIVIDNKTRGIVSISGNKNTLSSNKQPGSSIKPILVYAPAIEHGLISPATKILDEKINIGGYSPSNADKKYHGYVSVRESLKNSYNIPAVKILSELGLSKSKSFCKNLNITLNENDNHLATALGAFSKGVKLKNLADAYSAFSTSGNFSESKFIKEIKSGNKTIYTHSNNKTKAMSDSTAFLITDILMDTSKNGTAKRLKDFSFDIASKTGTVGIKNSKNNTDAYCVSYTTNHTILCYFGESEMPETINGATYPTMLTKDILDLLYKNNKPSNFEKPNSVSKINISKQDYSNNIISQTSNLDDSFEEYFSNNNLPKMSIKSQSLEFDVFNFENQKPIICLNLAQNNQVKIFRKNKNEEELIFSTSNKNSLNSIKYEDETAASNEIYEYYAEIFDTSSNQSFKTKTIKLKTY